MNAVPCSCPGGRYDDYCPRHGHLKRVPPTGPQVIAPKPPRPEQRSVFEPGDVFHTFNGTVMRLWRCQDDGSIEELWDEPDEKKKVLPKMELGPGMAPISLMDANGQPVSQRAVNIAPRRGTPGRLYKDTTTGEVQIITDDGTILRLPQEAAAMVTQIRNAYPGRSAG